MYSQDLESRILRLALDRGCLDRATPEDLDPAPLLDPELLKRSSSFGPRLDRLVDKGLLDRKLLEALVWEAILGPQPAGQSSMKPSLLPAEGSVPKELPDFQRDLDPSLSGRFLDFQLLGEGATAKVYKAFDPHLQRWVALKFLKTARGGQGEAVLAEARAQAKVEHPNVCRVHEVGQLGEHGYILMEYARGATLDHESRTLDLRTKVALLRDVAEGVHAAHRQGLIHLDLKPGNILLQPEDGASFRPLVTDFGMVATEGRDFQGSPCPMGTPPYSSPEQISGRLDLLDRRSDIYSLGVVLYVLLCVSFPFDAEDYQGLIEAIQHRKPVPIRRRDSKIPEELEAILETCLAKDPLKRYPSALALADDLQRFLSGEPVQAMAQGRIYRVKKWAQRNRALAGVSLAAILLCSGLAVLGLAGIYRVQTQARLAKQFQHEADGMESLLRDAHGMPFHDLTPEVAKVHARMDAVRAEMAREGKLAQGPGLYALGRAYLRLGDPEKASEQLQQAWDLGYRAPEEAAALGEAYGRIYVLRLAEFSNLKRVPIAIPFTNEEIAPSILRRLKQEYGEPSKRYLRLGQSSMNPEQRLYFEGVVALHEGQTGLAIERAREFAKADPWDPEAMLLEASAYRALATRALVEARYPDTQAALDHMESAIKRAQELARSSPSVFEAEVQHQYFQLVLKAFLHKATEQDLQEALAATERSLQLDPASWMAYTHRAAIYIYWSYYNQGLGGDIRKPLDQAVEAAGEALKLNPDFTWALNVQASALTTLGSIDRRFYGIDNRDAEARALEIYRRLLRLSPLKDQVLLNMGSSYSMMGIFEATRGEARAASDLDEGVQCYLKAAEVNEAAEVYFYMGTPYKWRGLLADWRGEDPMAYYDRAIAAYRHSLSLSPVAFVTNGRLADLLILRAERRLSSGADPGPDIEEAIQAAERSIAQKADAYIGHSNRGEALTLRAQWKTLHHIDPSTDLQSAEQEITASRRWLPADPELTKDFIELDRERLRWALASGGPIDAALADGLRYAERTLQLNPTHAKAYLVKAELLLLAAQRKDPRAARWRSDAHRALERCEALNPNLHLAVARTLKELG